MGMRRNAVDPVAWTDSPIGRWDPRAKLAGLVPLLGVQACARSVPAAALGLSVCLLVLAAGRLPLRFWTRRMVVFAAFLLPFVLLLPVMGSGPEVARIGGIAIHAGGLEFASLILLRATGVIALAMALLHTAPLTDTLWAAQSLGVPRSLVQLALITLRYLPILDDEYETAHTAAACRGWQPRATAHGYRTTAHLAAATLVRGHRRADRVWQAMACRGFAGRLYPSCEWRMTFHDVAATIAMWLVAATLVVAG
jgi:cobalt/nickel transport system permease protein